MQAWQKFKNLFLSCQTHTDLSPDLRVRQQINQWLLNRPALAVDEWFECFFQPAGIDRGVASFVFTSLKRYSGLHWERVQPGDRLNEDLALTLVCWFDWHLCLCDDFLERFGVDISSGLDLMGLSTVEDLVVFLHNEWRSLPSTL